MTLSAPMRCSALAEQLGEPLVGTVDQRRRWLLLEDRSAWGTDAVGDRFGAEAVAEAKRRGLRLLLVRRHEGDPADDAARRAFLVDTQTREAAWRLVGLPGELSIGEASSLPVSEFGSLQADPLLLVCTNGRRDACCALRGRALVAALAAEHAARLWECSHLGGHRFAANVVWLPDGVVHGRVMPAHGPPLARRLLAGRLDPDHLRGRSAWPAPAQVAEVVLRRRLGLDGLDDLTLLDADVGAQRAEVTLRTADGGQHRFELVAEAAEPPRPTSCRGDELEQPVHWSVVSG